MRTIWMYDPLHPLLMWAVIAAGCAALLAVQGSLAFSLTRAPLRSIAGIVGAVSVGLNIGAVALAARAYGAALDLTVIATCYDHPVRGCEQWLPWIDDALGRVAALGMGLLVATLVCLIAGSIGMLIWRQAAAREQARGSTPQAELATRSTPPVAFAVILVAIFLVDFGVYLTTQGIARWQQTAYLADITRAGDGIGQLPLVYAIFGTCIGTLVLLASLGLFIVVVRRTPARSAD